MAQIMLCHHLIQWSPPEERRQGLLETLDGGRSDGEQASRSKCRLPVSQEQIDAPQHVVLDNSPPLMIKTQADD